MTEDLRGRERDHNTESQKMRGREMQSAKQ